MENLKPNNRGQCPCKKLPLFLSSFTAAEYGDLHSLEKIVDKDVDCLDSSGYTPLHLAAQNGHTAATAFLIYHGALIDSNACGATPLHRASFSGAVSTMRILLESKADVRMIDSSFGDGQTPLHKSASGGRPLAVKLLLDWWSQSESFVNNELSILKLKDSRGMTPLEVALESKHEGNFDSVKRWDHVAGGPPDWELCVKLLEEAEFLRDSKNIQERKAFKDVPIPDLYSISDLVSCLQCDDSKGSCRTTNWEKQFQSILASSLERSSHKAICNDSFDLPRNESSHNVNDTKSSHDTKNRATTATSFPRHSEALLDREYTSSLQDPRHNRGKPCFLCGKLTFAFSCVNKNLYCKNCARKARKS